MPDELTRSYSKGTQAIKVSISKCLKELAEATPSGILILGGLDECLQMDQQEILVICQELIKNVKALMVSRGEAQIYSGLQKAAAMKPFHHAIITADQNHESIRNFIARGVKVLGLDDGPQEAQIVVRLLDGTKGVFLWARLMLEHLSNILTFADIAEALAQAPHGLENMYGRTSEDMN